MPDSAIPTTLADLGHPPAADRARKDWVLEQFVGLGQHWYNEDDSARKRQLEALAVQLLRTHWQHAPARTRIRQAVAWSSFLPAVAEDLWLSANPAQLRLRAEQHADYMMVGKVTSRMHTLREAGDTAGAEQLRRRAVSFFNVYLTGSDDLAQYIARHAKTALRKRD